MQEKWLLERLARTRDFVVLNCADTVHAPFNHSKRKHFTPLPMQTIVPKSVRYLYLRFVFPADECPACVHIGDALGVGGHHEQERWRLEVVVGPSWRSVYTKEQRTRTGMSQSIQASIRVKDCPCLVTFELLQLLLLLYSRRFRLPF